MDMYWNAIRWHSKLSFVNISKPMSILSKMYSFPSFFLYFQISNNGSENYNRLVNECQLRNLKLQTSHSRTEIQNCAVQ